MWIVIRIVLAAIGFCVRLLSRRRRTGSDPMATRDGVPCFEMISRHKGKIVGFRVGMPLASRTWVRMHRESGTDRFFKRLGIANELQSGDAAFDDRVYVTCDHPHVHALLRDAPELRAAITAAFDAGYERIELDGRTLWLHRRSSMAPSDRDRDLLAAVHRAARTLEQDPPSRLRDPFVWKAFVVEGVIWSILGYAIGGLIEWAAHKEDYHLRPSEVVVAGMVVAVCAFLVLLLVITFWLRGSSRGHRIIVESAIVLLLGLPVTSIQVVGDTNRSLDDAPSTEVVRTVDYCEVRVHRGKRGRKSYSYHVWLVPEADRRGPSLPPDVQVQRAFCDAASEGSEITFEIAPGRWGIPWYRAMHVNGETWTAP